MDIRWWLQIESKATRWPDGRIDLELVGRNRSQQAIQTAVVEVACSDDRFAVQLDDIPPFDEVSTQLALPSGTDCREYTTELYSASWRLDRFQ